VTVLVVTCLLCGAASRIQFTIPSVAVSVIVATPVFVIPVPSLGAVIVGAGPILIVAVVVVLQPCLVVPEKKERKETKKRKESNVRGKSLVQYPQLKSPHNTPHNIYCHTLLHTLLHAVTH
jgi:hypothetical protein